MKLRNGWWLVLVLGAAVAPRGARAQSGETSRTAAETLFVEAKKLMEAGRFAEACPKLADSQRLDPGVGTLLNLARCYEHIGKVASAWSTYRDAAAAARTAGQADRENIARQRAAALEPRLSRLTVAIPAPMASIEGLEVRLDGVIMPSSLWGVAAPVDPGQHQIDVGAKGRKTWSTKVEVAPPTNPTVAIPELENAPIEAKGSVGAESGEAPRPKTSQRTVALVLGGAGIAALGVGTFFGFSAKSTYHQADADCSEKNVCNANGTDLRNSAFSKATVSTIAFGVGGAALASGAILWFTAPKVDAEAPRVGVAFAPGAMTLRGAW